MRNRNDMMDVFGLMNDIFNDVGVVLRDLNPQQAPRQLRQLVAGDFPPANIKVDQDKNFIIECALAGVDEKEISLDVEGRALHLSVEKKEAGKPCRTFQQGIRSFTSVENTYQVPKQWNLDNLKAEYKNGLLTITIPAFEDVKKVSEKKSITLITE